MIVEHLVLMEAPVYGEGQHVLPLHHPPLTHYFDFPPHPAVHHAHHSQSPAVQLWLHLIKWEFCNSNELYIHKKERAQLHFSILKM